MIELLGLKAGQVVTEPIWVEAVIKDSHSRWPIKRVEFFIDDLPFSYKREAPYILGAQEWWNPSSLSEGPHLLRVVAYDRRGPRFTEACSILDVPFRVAYRSDLAGSPPNR